MLLEFEKVTATKSEITGETSDIFVANFKKAVHSSNYSSWLEEAILLSTRADAQVGSLAFRSLIRENVFERTQMVTGPSIRSVFARVSFVVLVVRVALLNLFEQPHRDVEIDFIDGAGDLINRYFQNQTPKTKIQMAVIGAVQRLLYDKESEFAPHAHPDSEKRYGEVAFHSLYGADVVDELAFYRWKYSAFKGKGKKELIRLSKGFFEWLEESDSE